jgi:hypothetical protein
MFPNFFFFNQGASSEKPIIFISIFFFFFKKKCFGVEFGTSGILKKKAKLQRNKNGLICLDISTIVESYFSHGDGPKGLYVEDYYFFSLI